MVLMMGRARKKENWRWNIQNQGYGILMMLVDEKIQ